ncbi:putative ribonuclease H-like domain-containing protein [Tanacetum coccineum]
MGPSVLANAIAFLSIVQSIQPRTPHQPSLQTCLDDLSDYAGASLDRKSTTGGCQFLGGRLISWQCKKRTVVANSTTEAEYVAALMKNPVFQTKHIKIRHHFIRDSNEKKLIQMIKIHTDKNVTDLLTKAFDKGIGVNACDSKLMLLGINLLLLEKVNVARHNLLLLVVKTVNGEVQLQALVDGKKVIITETSVRRDLQLEDAKGIACLPNADIFKQLALMGYEKPSQKLTFYKDFFSPQWKFLIHTIMQCLSAKSTAWNEFSSTMASAIICLATNQKFNFSKYIFESMVKNVDSSVKFLMYPRLDENLTKEDTQKGIHAFKVPSWIEAMTGRAATIQDTQKFGPGFEDPDFLNWSYTKVENAPLWNARQAPELLQEADCGVLITTTDGEYCSCFKLMCQEDASKQGRKIDDIDVDEDITLENVHDADLFGVNNLDGDEVVVESKVTDKAGEKRNIVEEAVTVTDVITILVTAAIINNVKGQDSKDKGKEKMIELEMPLKKKDQIKFDEEEALRLQAKFDEEDRLAREKAQQVEEANIAWVNFMQDMDTDLVEGSEVRAEGSETRDRYKLEFV